MARSRVLHRLKERFGVLIRGARLLSALVPLWCDTPRSPSSGPSLTLAARLGLNPVTLLALVATCISFTFINPFSHQSNLMVMGPGGYSTRTFARFGAPLLVVSLATVSVIAWALLNRG